MEGLQKIVVHEQDRKLFWLLLQQKFLTLELILGQFAAHELALPPNKRGYYQRLRRLVRWGYLRIAHYQGRTKVYILSQLGWEALPEEQRHKLPLIQPDDMTTMRHDLIAAELRFYLESLGGTEWSADREFRQYAAQIVCNPDGAFTFQGKDYLIEVELSQKSRERYDALAQVYTNLQGPDAVLYFFENDEVIAYLKEQVAEHQAIAFFRLDTPLPPPQEMQGWYQGRPITFAAFLNMGSQA